MCLNWLGKLIFKFMKNLQNIIRHIPILYAIFIFLSYYQLHIYYEKFKINIYAYINTGELLLFNFPIFAKTLTLFYLLFLFIFIIIIIYIPFHIIDQFRKPREQFIQTNTLQNFITDVNILKKKVTRKTVNKYFIIHFVIGLIINPITITFLILVGFSYLTIEPYVAENFNVFIKDSYFKENLKFYEYGEALKTLYFIWSIYIFYWINRLFLKKFKLYSDRVIYSTVFLIAFFIGLAHIDIEIKFSSILSHKPYELIKLKTKNKFLESDTINIYLGSTQDYIFITNIDSNLIQVIPKTEIEELIFKKLK